MFQMWQALLIRFCTKAPSVPPSILFSFSSNSLYFLILLGEIYNVSSDDEMSNLELAKKLLKLYGISEADGITFVEDRAFNDHRFASFFCFLHSVMIELLVRGSYAWSSRLTSTTSCWRLAGSDLHDAYRYFIDGNKLNALGWNQLVSFDEGLKRTSMLSYHFYIFAPFLLIQYAFQLTGIVRMT